MSEFGKLGRLIQELERDEKEKIKKEQLDEALFEYHQNERRKKEIAAKGIMKMTWADANFLDDMRKEQEELLNPTDPFLNYYEQYKKRQGMHNMETAATFEAVIQKDDQYEDDLLNYANNDNKRDFVVHQILTIVDELINAGYEKEKLSKVKELFKQMQVRFAEQDKKDDIPRTGNEEVEIGQDRTVVETVGKNLGHYCDSLSEHEKNLHNLRIIQGDLSEVLSLGLEPTEEIKKNIITLGKVISLGLEPSEEITKNVSALSEMLCPCNDDKYEPKEKQFYLKKSDNGLISGFCSVEIIDKQGHFLPLTTLKNALPQYLQHGTLMLQHSNRVIGKVTDYAFKKNPEGKDGLWISAKLYDGNQDIEDKIGTDYTGFSIAGDAILKDECNTSLCWKNIQSLKLYEISLCKNPANQAAVLD